TREAKKSLGYVPELPQIYDELTLQEHLRMIAAMYELTDEVYEKKSKELLTLFSLNERLTDFPADFSKGMQQ
ncbi:MAG TPA: multidrug ABC transporter ATP-binding protein, partial [Paenibacillaceae bacterium]|nr:multidrug ABC transporter ATP-binding protein [Paenibacillaceae bacterium]